jgi:hypothetical protein
VLNRALTKMGARVLTSVDEDTEGARLWRANYPSLRRAEMRRYLWNFAMTRAQLPSSDALVAWGWTYAYQLPLDWLRTARVGLYGYDEPAYTEEGGAILTEALAPLPIRYIRDETDPNRWDAAFVEVFASRMALELCERVTQSTSRKELLAKEYQSALADAKRLDAIENEPELVGGTEPWIEARFGRDIVGASGWR